MDHTIILNFGDSQGEVWDYIFYNNSNYIKFKDSNVGWRSGWSIRGLNKVKNKHILFDYLYTLKTSVKNIFIILTFGSVDIEWNLSYKRFIKKENPNLEFFIKDMCEAFMNIILEYLNIEEQLNKNNNLINFFIIVSFPFMPLPLSEDYMKNFSRENNTEYYQVISHKERCYLWNLYCDKMIDIINNLNKSFLKKIYIIDVRRHFIKNGFLEYSNTLKEDHHPDFTKTQKLIISNLKNINFINNEKKEINLKLNSWQNNYLYRHIRRPLK